MPITLYNLEELAIYTTLDADATTKPRFSARRPLTKFIVLPVSAKAVIKTLLNFTAINTFKKTS